MISCCIHSVSVWDFNMPLVTDLCACGHYAGEHYNYGAKYPAPVPPTIPRQYHYAYLTGQCDYASGYAATKITCNCPGFSFINVAPATFAPQAYNSKPQQPPSHSPPMPFVWIDRPAPKAAGRVRLLSCECGAAKALKAPHGSPLHSSYCPVRP